MSTEFKSSIVSETGKTRLRAALERARDGGAPCVGQWMDFPGFTLARTIAGLGADVSPHQCWNVGMLWPKQHGFHAAPMTPTQIR